MASLQFEIEHRYRPREKLVVEHSRALVGSAAHCEVRLPLEDTAPEALVFESRDEELFVTSLVNDGTTLLAGRPLLSGPMQSGAAIQIGSCILTVSLLNAGGAVVQKSKVNPRTILLGALFVAAAAYAATRSNEDDSGYDLPQNSPALWRAKAGTCAQREPALAGARARELRSSAGTKRERSPFVPRDGVAAVALYRDAAACFRVASHEAEALETELDSVRLEKVVLEEYHLTQLRLERALADGDGDSALLQISVLKSMLESEPGDYTARLGLIERRLLIRSGEKS